MFTSHFHNKTNELTGRSYGWHTHTQTPYETKFRRPKKLRFANLLSGNNLHNINTRKSVSLDEFIHSKTAICYCCCFLTATAHMKLSSVALLPPRKVTPSAELRLRISRPRCEYICTHIHTYIWLQRRRTDKRCALKDVPGPNEMKLRNNQIQKWD